MELLVAAHEKLHITMEEDLDTKRVMQAEFKPWEPENYDPLKKLNLKITELRHEHQSLRSSKSGSNRSSDRSSHKTNFLWEEKKSRHGCVSRKIKNRIDVC